MAGHLARNSVFLFPASRCVSTMLTAWSSLPFADDSAVAISAFHHLCGWQEVRISTDFGDDGSEDSE